MRYWGNNILVHLTTPIYVIRMNQARMGREAKKKWLLKLREACFATIGDINMEIRKMNREDQDL